MTDSGVINKFIYLFLHFIIVFLILHYFVVIIILDQWMLIGLPGLPGYPAQRPVTKVYRSDCVIVQIHRQQMVGNLAKGLPWKQRAAEYNCVQVCCRKIAKRF